MDLETILLELIARQALKMTQTQTLHQHSIESPDKMSVMQMKPLIPRLVAVELLQRIYVTLTVLLNSPILQSKIHTTSVNASLWSHSLDLETILLEPIVLQALRMTQTQTPHQHSIESLDKMSVMQAKSLNLKLVLADLPLKTYAK